jgi:hypothetical protein
MKIEKRKNKQIFVLKRKNMWYNPRIEWCSLDIKR